MSHRGLWLFALLALAVFVSHTSAVILLYWLRVTPVSVESPLEALLVTVISFPALYYFAWRPLVREINERKQVTRFLEESQAFSETVIAASSVGLLAYRQSGKCILANAAAARIIGATREDLLEQDFTQLESWRESGLLDLAKMVLAAGGESERAFQFTTSFGKVVWADFRLICFNSGSEPHLLMLINDISEQKKVEDQLRLQSTALEAADNGVIITDPNGKILWVNKGFVSMTGYSVAEVLGQNPRFLKSSLQDTTFYRRLWEDIKAGKIWRGELVNRRKDGTLYTQEMTITPLRTHGADITHFIAITQDITQRKESEETIRQQAALLDITQDAITVRDLETRILFWNKGAERLYGWKAHEAIGRKAKDFLYHQDHLPQADCARILAEQNGSWRGELHQITRDNRTLTVEARLSLMHGHAAKPKAILFVSTDVTEKKSLEKQFLRAQRLESLGTLAAGIAHDLNNILAPISMCADLLQVKSRDQEDLELLATIEASAKRGAEVVKQVLTFGRGIEGQRVPLQTAYLIKEIEKIVRETFPKSILFQTDVPKDLWSVTGDVTQLHQVLLNLCVNARDAMLEGGTMLIAAENVEITEKRPSAFGESNKGPYVLLKVSDTGHGIPPHLWEKIFEPFFTTKERGKGTGLGLSTVLGIVRSHGGFIDIHSPPSKGSTFEVFLPAARRAAVGVPQVPAATACSGTGQCVLLVEDEPKLQLVSQTALEKHGYRVLLASNGRLALDVLSAHPARIQAVITDIMMPTMDGVAFVQALRKSHPDIPVIACTGWAEDGIHAQLRDLGVDSFLSKPFTAQELLTTLHMHLGGRSAVC